MTEDSFPLGPVRLSDLSSEPDDPFGSERAAAQLRRGVLRGRDAPERHTDPATLASIGASLIPGSEFVDLAGYLPDFRGGYEPSLLENFRQGNRLAGGLQLAGAFIPGFGVLRKVARATAGARRLAQRERIFDETIRRADGEVPQFDLKRSFPDTVPDDLATMLAKEGLEKEMLGFIEQGRKKGALNWFNTEPLRQVFLKELGPQEGEQAFRKYIHFVAATSAASDVGSNARNASRYFGLDARGEGLPEIGERMLSPYHHRSARNHQIFVRKNFEDEADQLRYPKLSSMFQNLLGNYDPVTIDRHALRLPAMLTKDPNFLKPEYQKMLGKRFTIDELAEMPGAWRHPTEQEYAALEQFYKRLAQKAGLRPAEAAVAAWVGGADKTRVFDNGLLSFMQHFEDRLHLTADREKMPVAEVLRRFVRGQVDLASLGGQQQYAIA